MSNPKFGPKLDHLDPWIEALENCGCCPPPRCCPPKLECRSVGASALVGAWHPMDWEPPSGSEIMEEFPVLYLSRKYNKTLEIQGSATTTYNFKVRNTGTGLIVRELENSTTLTVSDKKGVFDEVLVEVEGWRIVQKRQGPWDCFDKVPKCNIEGVVTREYEREEVFSSQNETSGEIDSDTTTTESIKRWTEVIKQVEGEDSVDTDGCLEVVERDVSPTGIGFLDSTAMFCISDSQDLAESEVVTGTSRVFESVLTETGSAFSQTDWFPNPSGGQAQETQSCNGSRVSTLREEVTLSDPVTKPVAMSTARDRLVQWMEDIERICGSVSESVDEECSALVPVCGSDCMAKMEIEWPTEGAFGTQTATFSATISAFQYRWKLDSCCRNQKIRAEWDEVFFPKVFLAWLDEIRLQSEPGPPPVMPTVTKKAWQWEGTPPGCDESASWFEEDDRFLDESMWSPWSLPVLPPPGEEGIVVLRNLMIDCNPDSKWGSKPELMRGVLPEYDASDLDNNEETQV